MVQCVVSNPVRVWTVQGYELGDGTGCRSAPRHRWSKSDSSAPFQVVHILLSQVHVRIMDAYTSSLRL